MTTSLFNTRQSAASDLHTYGLAGIELNRTTERREATRQHDLITLLSSRPERTSPVRQWIGDAIIRMGVGIAGEAARRPRVTPETHPRIDMA